MFFFFSFFYFTLLKSTAGFLPRHKFDKHHTALRIIVKRVLRVKILKKQKIRTKYKSIFTSLMAEVHPYREHNHDIQDYLQRYYQVPKQPKQKYISLRREN